MLELDEVAQHPHNAARQATVRVDGMVQPAPRFDGRVASQIRASVRAGADSREVLGLLGRTDRQIEALIAEGIVQVALPIRTGGAGPSPLGELYALI